MKRIIIHVTSAMRITPITPPIIAAIGTSLLELLSSLTFKF
jgi:hypothetical protein